jgi:hypothetical protein
MLILAQHTRTYTFLLFTINAIIDPITQNEERDGNTMRRTRRRNEDERRQALNF